MQKVSLKRILLLLSPVIVIVGVGYYVTHPSEPRYRGRPLSQWRADLDESKPLAVRQRAEAILIEAAQKAAPDLVKALQARDSQLRLTVAGWAKQVGLHIQTAEERRSRARRQFLQFGVGAIPVLTNLFENPELAVEATRMLNVFGLFGSSATKPLIDALQHTNEMVREEAAAGLVTSYLNQRFGSMKGDFPTNEVVAALLKCLKDPVPNVQIVAAYGLGRMKDQSPVVVPALIEILDATNHLYVRKFAAEALGRFGEKASAAVPQLKELSRSEEPLVRQTAEEAIRKIEN